MIASGRFIHAALRPIRCALFMFAEAANEQEGEEVRYQLGFRKAAHGRENCNKVRRKIKIKIKIKIKKGQRTD